MVVYSNDADNTLGSISMIIFGNSVSSDVTIDLEQAPFSLNFNQNYPIANNGGSFTPSSPSGITVTSITHLNKSQVKLTFSGVLPTGEQLSGSFGIWYNSKA